MEALIYAGIAIILSEIYEGKGKTYSQVLWSVIAIAFTLLAIFKSRAELLL